MTDLTSTALETVEVVKAKDEIVQSSRSKTLLHRLFLLVSGFLVVIGAQSFFTVARPSVHTVEGHISQRVHHDRINSDDAKEQHVKEETEPSLPVQPNDEIDSQNDSAGRERQQDETNRQPHDAQNDEEDDLQPDKEEDVSPDDEDVPVVPPHDEDEAQPDGEDEVPDTRPKKVEDEDNDDLSITSNPNKKTQSLTSRVKSRQPLGVDSVLAMDFVNQRKEAYNVAGLDYRWKLRGIGYLYETHQLVLMAFLPPPGPLGSLDIASDGDGTARNTQPKQSIIVRNVNEETATFSDCEKLTIWVRVSGPEIFADAATAVKDEDNDTCYWIFEFDLRVPGTYEVDVKVLIWNGAAPINGTVESQCEFSKGPMDNATLAKHKHDGFQGFKMYKPAQMCCEICARTPLCQAWATPFLRVQEAWSGKNGCELLFPLDAPDSVLPVSSLWPPKRRALRGVEEFHGLVHTNPTSYFCGCGWSFWFTLDFPCMSGDLDDRVFMTKSNFTAVFAMPQEGQDDRSMRKELLERSSLPLCTLTQERVGKATHGRWVRERWPEETTCPKPYATATLQSKSFPMTQFDDTNPSCWHREDLSKIGSNCLEMNCQLIDKKLQWISHLHDEKEFFGMWRPYDCSYVQFTTSQLQECITKKKIVRFEKKGASVAEFAGEFMEHRLVNITLYEDTSDADALTVVYDTLALLHMNGPDYVIHEFLSTLPIAPKNEEHYWISGFFLSSEREVHAHAIRMQQYNRILAEGLNAKNYKMINAFDLTPAFTYDTATQMDGMHMVGPPMKMIVTKILHHLCKDVVDGMLV